MESIAINIARRLYDKSQNQGSRLSPENVVSSNVFIGILHAFDEEHRF